MIEVKDKQLNTKEFSTWLQNKLAELGHPKKIVFPLTLNQALSILEILHIEVDRNKIKYWGISGAIPKPKNDSNGSIVVTLEDFRNIFREAVKRRSFKSLPSIWDDLHFKTPQTLSHECCKLVRSLPRDQIPQFIETITLPTLAILTANSKRSEDQQLLSDLINQKMKQLGISPIEGEQN